MTSPEHLVWQSGQVQLVDRTCLGALLTFTSSDLSGWRDKLSLSSGGKAERRLGVASDCLGCLEPPSRHLVLACPCERAWKRASFLCCCLSLRSSSCCCRRCSSCCRRCCSCCCLCCSCCCFCTKASRMACSAGLSPSGFCALLPQRFPNFGPAGAGAGAGAEPVPESPVLPDDGGSDELGLTREARKCRRGTRPTTGAKAAFLRAVAHDHSTP